VVGLTEDNPAHVRPERAVCGSSGSSEC
jgi:hypothetical protein